MYPSWPHVGPAHGESHAQVEPAVAAVLGEQSPFRLHDRADVQDPPPRTCGAEACEAGGEKRSRKAKRRAIRRPRELISPESAAVHAGPVRAEQGPGERRAGEAWNV